MEAKTTFHEVERKQAFDGLIQQVDLEPIKKYNDLELYLGDLMEYLHPQLDKFLKVEGPGIFFWWSVQVNYNPPLVKDVDEDEEEHWDDEHDDEDDDDDDMENPVYLHTGKIYIPTKLHLAEKLEEARQIILQRNNGSIRGHSNVVIESIGNMCFKVFTNANPVRRRR